jgi:hypothetical protein
MSTKRSNKMLLHMAIGWLLCGVVFLFAAAWAWSAYCEESIEPIAASVRLPDGDEPHDGWFHWKLVYADYQWTIADYWASRGNWMDRQGRTVENVTHWLPMPAAPRGLSLVLHEFKDGDATFSMWRPEGMTREQVEQELKERHAAQPPGAQHE